MWYGREKYQKVSKSETRTRLKLASEFFKKCTPAFSSSLEVDLKSQDRPLSRARQHQPYDLILSKTKQSSCYYFRQNHPPFHREKEVESGPVP